MKIKTTDLSGPALDWAVAKVEGYFSTAGQKPEYWESSAGAKHFIDMHKAKGHGVHWAHTTTDWAEGGPIIDREHISVGWLIPAHQHRHLDGCWSAHIPGSRGEMHYGSTFLIAAMRCYVASKLGDTVEVPDEFFNHNQGETK